MLIVYISNGLLTTLFFLAVFLTIGTRWLMLVAR
jgi:hypothetical protein